MGNYYAYRHTINQEGKEIPFYVGIGSKKNKKEFKTYKSEYQRAFAFGSTNRNKEWQQVYSSVNGNINVDIFYETDSLNEIEAKEKEFIDLYGRKAIDPSGILINLCKGGRGRTGIKQSNSAREKISTALKGIKRGPLSEEHKQKLSKARRNWNYADHLSPESREQMTLRLKERHKNKPNWHSEETKKKIGLNSLGNKNNLGKQNALGYKHTEESKRKMSESQKGKKLTEEQKQKISEFHKGRKRSPEAIEKTRLANIGRKMSPEQKERLRQVNLGRKKTPEEIEKRRLSMRGKKRNPLSEETKRKIGEANKKYTGRKPSQETREKMRLAKIRYNELNGPYMLTPEQREKARLKMIGRKTSEETRKKMSESHLRRHNKI